MAKNFLMAHDVEQLENTSPVMPVLDPQIGIDTPPPCRFYSTTDVTQNTIVITAPADLALVAQ